MMKYISPLYHFSDFLFVESNNTVSVLVPKLIRERISCHMDQDQFEVALQLAVSSK